MRKKDQETCAQPRQIDPLSADLNDLSLAQLRACVDVSKAITAELNPDRLIPTIMEKVSKLLPSENWSLFLLDEASQTLKFEISVDIDIETVKNFRLALGQGVAGHAALTKKVLVIEDVSQCDFFFDQVDSVTGRRTTSLICVPILYAGRTMGVLEVVNPKRMDAAVLALLNLLSDYLAIAIENTRRYKLVEEMAVRDSLTGLYNQRYLYPALQRHLSACRRNGRPLSLVFADMDDFKDVVDRLGHLNGSRALSEVAQRIAACVSEPACAVAYGGDEFLLILPETDRAQALAVADHVREAIQATPYLAQWGHQVKLTASFGVATFPDDAEDIAALLALADKAMFGVKTSGKNRVDANQP
ncbi:MAG: sensor domain-containing diguanylate cyclase [Desulfobacteraceae bacterium]|nr:sensor domain-containing diguanylate cyclase [Desulfobacteraceae bacterium]